jgi:hypothetical protein
MGCGEFRKSNLTGCPDRHIPLGVAGPQPAARRNVREKGLEPSRPKAQEPKSCVYTNFTTPLRSLIADTRVNTLPGAMMIG